MENKKSIFTCWKNIRMEVALPMCDKEYEDLVTLHEKMVSHPLDVVETIKILVERAMDDYEKRGMQNDGL